MGNFSILRICMCNPQSAGDFYRRKGLGNLSYAEQLRELQKENFALPGSWSECMYKLGNRAKDIIVNFELLQRSWCKENGIKVDFRHDDWIPKVLVAQIKSFRPDVLFFYAGGFHEVKAHIRRAFRQEIPFVKIITGFWGDELTWNQYKDEFADLDIVFTSSSAYKKYFDSTGIPAHTIGNCYDPSIEDLIDKTEAHPIYDFIFSGTTGYASLSHRQRYIELVEIMRRTNLNIWCNEKDLEFLGIVSFVKWPFKVAAFHLLNLLDHRQLKYLRSKIFKNGPFANAIDWVLGEKHIPVDVFFAKNLKIRRLFPGRSHPPLLKGSDYYNLLRNTRIVLNRHRNEAADCGNIRVYETTGLGSCLVTDRGRELREFFIPEEEIVTYSSVDECVEKVNYLLAHDDKRKEISAKGQQRTLSEHTVMHRCMKINDILQKML